MGPLILATTTKQTPTPNRATTKLGIAWARTRRSQPAPKHGLGPSSNDMWSTFAQLNLDLSP
eukprot:9222386-Karenia_brevis.AAC.1